MNLSQELSWRGFVNQTTFAQLTDVDQPRTFYFGVDPSAPSMTIGNLAAIMMVRAFISHGHKAILLVGGATGMIGDPDGKKDERNLKTLEEIASNKARIAAQYSQVLGGQPFEVVDNYDWFKDISYLDFLRDIGKHMSMTQLLDREFVQSRIGQGGSGISYAEFSYSLIQGYDFLHLHREYGASLQLCGADQWGNSVTGASLIRKLAGGEAHVYATPLVVNRATGQKFGKTEGGAIWLDPTLTSPYQFYQFWLNLDDDGVKDYLKIYSLIEPNDYDQLMSEFTADPAGRSAQKYLAYEVTKLVHGQSAAESAGNVTATLFSGTKVSDLQSADLDMLAQEIPVAPASSLVDALVASGLATSNGEARRLIDGGAISINGQKVLDSPDVSALSLIKKGKNSFLLIK